MYWKKSWESVTTKFKSKEDVKKEGTVKHVKYFKAVT